VIRHLLRRLGRCLLVLLLGAASHGSAWAHASLVEATPADRAVLDDTPAQVVLRFDEAVTPLSLTVVGPAGDIALPGSIEVAGQTLRASLPRGLARGTYVVTWRVVSADGHPIGAALAFGIGSAPGIVAPAAAADARWVLMAEVLRFLLYAGLAIGAGGALFRAVVAEPSAPMRRAMAGAALIGMLVALGGLGVAGATLKAAVYPVALLDPATWQAATVSTAFPRALMTSGGLALTAAALVVPGRLAAWFGSLGAVMAAAGLSLSGHAAIGGWPVQFLLAAHVLAAAYWLGSFLPLLAALKDDGRAALPVVRRFAALAIPAVGVLLLTGAIQAALHMRGWEALFEIDYGRLVLAKGIGATILLLFAALNRWRLTPALHAGGALALRRSIRAEAAVAGIVLGITAVLGVTPPHAAHGPGHEGHGAGHGDTSAPGVVIATQIPEAQFLLEVTPAMAGPNRITLRIERSTGGPLVSQEVWLELAQADAGIAGLRRQMHAEAAGVYRYEGSELAVPGRWTARVEVLVGDFDQLASSLSFDVAPRR
jgi:copper transport protein